MRRSIPAALLALALAGPARPDAHAPQAGAPASVVAFLEQAIGWYHQQLAQAQQATDPADVVYADATRHQAAQALALAFEFARADAALQPAGETPAAPRGQATRGAQDLQQRAASADAEAARARANVDALQRRASAAPARRRAAALARLQEARSRLELATARRDALKALADFSISQAAQGGGGLFGQVEELRRSVPELGSGAPPPATRAAPPDRRATPTGIVALGADVLTLSRKLRELGAAEKVTADLRGAVEKQRAPLLAELRSTLQRAEPASTAGGDAGPGDRARALDTAATRVRAVAAALVPLGKQAVLLDAQRATLSEWHGAVDAEWDAGLRRLGLHGAVLAIVIAAILAASGAWRTATFRYVRDRRRQRQSMLVRRIVVAFAILLVVTFSFVTELGSMATVAGFVTAGLAVALQNVILSVAAYFFLIGKYGIGVGDRVQIAGVTGEVIEIGLVRLHLMELRQDGLPSGRVVVFSNAVVFQPTANFFKQIPGSSYGWHALKLTVSTGSDYRRAEQRVLEAVGSVYEGYRGAIERQHAAMAAQLSPLTVEVPRPHTALQLTDSGLELTVRFPVPLDRARAIDDAVTRALLDAIGREPRLAVVGSGTPTIQAVPAPAAG